MAQQSNITIFGAGKIGEMVAMLLSTSGDYAVTMVDRDEAAFAKLNDLNVQTKIVDVTDPAQVDAALQGMDFTLSALPFHLTKNIAVAAKKAKVHYFDLTEDVATSHFVRELAQDAECAFVPQSGLAPGFISIAANHLAQNFESIEDLQMRVGALAKYPNNAIKYNLTWSTEGLVNEYIHPCNALVNGAMVQVPALDGREHFSLDGIDYEAFNTSGGLGTICETLAGKARNVNYKSIRYPGHLDIMRTLLIGLKLRDNPKLLVDILENAIPATKQDTVLVFVSATGQSEGRYIQKTYVTKVYAQEIQGKVWSAIQVTTAGSVCAVIDLVRNGDIPRQGFIKQEEIDFNAFCKNRFGRYYKEGELSDGL